MPRWRLPFFRHFASAQYLLLRQAAELPKQRRLELLHKRAEKGKECVMNDGLKYGLWFLGGLALGALGTVALSRGKLDFKPLATDLLSRGMDVRDALLSKVEAFKEDMEDLAAEARQAAEKRKVAPDTEA